MEAIRVSFVTTKEKDFVLPVTLKFVDQVLNLESNTRLNLSLISLSEHALKAILQIVEINHIMLGLVLFLSLTLNLILSLVGRCRLNWGRLSNLLGLGVVSDAISLVLSCFARVSNRVGRQCVKHVA